MKLCRCAARSRKAATARSKRSPKSPVPSWQINSSTFTSRYHQDCFFPRKSSRDMNRGGCRRRMAAPKLTNGSSRNTWFWQNTGHVPRAPFPCTTRSRFRQPQMCPMTVQNSARACINRVSVRGEGDAAGCASPATTVIHACTAFIGPRFYRARPPPDNHDTARSVDCTADAATVPGGAAREFPRPRSFCYTAGGLRLLERSKERG